MDGIVIAVSKSAGYTFSKVNQASIRLLAGLGVEGDAHMGEKVKHRFRVKKNPNESNLRQAHLIQAELFDELRAKGFHVSAGQIGENITTRGIDLLRLPKGARLHLGNDAVVEITGLRDPCEQLNDFQNGLLKACIEKDEHGQIIRKTGVMSVVIVGGEVFPNDPIRVEYPQGDHHPLDVV